MKNNLFPLGVFDRRRDKRRNIDACEEVREQKDNEPMSSVIRKREYAATEIWGASHGRQ